MVLCYTWMGVKLMIRFNIVNPTTGRREKIEAPKWSEWPAFRKQLMKLSPKFHAIMSA